MKVIKKPVPTRAIVDCCGSCAGSGWSGGVDG